MKNRYAKREVKKQHLSQFINLSFHLVSLFSFLLQDHWRAIKERETEMPASYIMNGGDGPQSYAQNSSTQRRYVDAAQETMHKEIVNNLDINQLLTHSPNTFCIADFGCSTGSNTFAAVQIILEAVELKFRSEGGLNSQVPEFQVFFCDLASNDFNILFSSLPPKRRYYAAGVPGSFHDLLFPKGSLHFVYSSSALNWLSEVPKEVLDKNSPAWNDGRILYSSTKKEVSEAYSAQFAKDFETFLNARAQELVGGGLMSLVIPGVPNMISLSQTNTGFQFEGLGRCLLDMTKMGLVSEEKVDSFNLPVYFPTPRELEAVIKRNGCFSIERMEIFSNTNKDVMISIIQKSSLAMRAVFEDNIEKHFESKITNKLFELYSKKIAEPAAKSLSPDLQLLSVVFVFLSRVRAY